MKTQFAAVLVAGAYIGSAAAAEEGQARRIPEARPQINRVERAARQGDNVVGLPDGAWQKRSSYLRGRIYHSAVWTYGEMIVWGGGSEHQFYGDGGIYDPETDRWRPTSLRNAPSGRWAHAAVWTGREMIIWGGRSSFAPSQHKSDGGLYDPATDTWRAMSTVGAPTPRSQMAAVWTGQEMIVWGGWTDGGSCTSTGGCYNPVTDTWTPLPEDRAPEARMEPAFVWTGRELIVWGGLLAPAQRSCGTGGRFDPESRTWKPLPEEGAPASARGMSAVWTGKEMLIWSGSHLEEGNLLNIGMKSGARYDPATDQWHPTSTTGAPEGRLYYGAVWTGDELVIWSGGDQVKGHLPTGGRYNPRTDRWTTTSTNGVPSGRAILTAVWTGQGVLFYGGSTGGVDAFNETFHYDPRVSDSAESQALPVLKLRE